MLVKLTLLLQEGDNITGGDIFGKVVENTLIVHHIMLPPGEMGTIHYLAKADNYTLKVKIDYEWNFLSNADVIGRSAGGGVWREDQKVHHVTDLASKKTKAYYWQTEKWHPSAHWPAGTGLIISVCSPFFPPANLSYLN